MLGTSVHQELVRCRRTSSPTVSDTVGLAGPALSAQTQDYATCTQLVVHCLLQRPRESILYMWLEQERQREHRPHGCNALYTTITLPGATGVVSTLAVDLAIRMPGKPRQRKPTFWLCKALGMYQPMLRWKFPRSCTAVVSKSTHAKHRFVVSKCSYKTSVTEHSGPRS
jgi:hypothetical protein